MPKEESIFSLRCPFCGYSPEGQKTGICPSCDNPMFARTDRRYPINPADLRAFLDFDEKGGLLDLFKNQPPPPGIYIYSPATDSRITLYVMGIMIAYSTLDGDPKIIYHDNPLNAIPPAVLVKAAEFAGLQIEQKRIFDTIMPKTRRLKNGQEKR